MLILKQSTAVDVLIGPFVDSTDGDTEETALTINASDVKLSKNGQTMAGKNDATACAHDANGMYNCELDATDTNTVGTLVLFVHVSGALAARHEMHVVEEAVYDAMWGASATGPLQPTTAGRTLDVTSGGHAGIDFANVNGTLADADVETLGVDVEQWNGAAVAVPTVAGVPEVDITHYGGAAGTFASGRPEVNTVVIEGSDASNTIEGACDASIVSHNLDHLLGASSVDADVVNNSVIAKLASKSATANFATYDNTTDSLEAQSDDAGDGLTAVPWNAAWDAEVQSEVTDALNAYDPPTNAEMEARTLVAANYFDPATDTVANVTTVANTTDVTNEVSADVTKISGSATAADRLELSALTIVSGAATGTPTTTTMAASALTEATDDHYIGRIIIWTSGALKDQATDITDYDGGNREFTFTATTEAATAGDTFIII